MWEVLAALIAIYSQRGGPQSTPTFTLDGTMGLNLNQVQQGIASDISKGLTPTLSSPAGGVVVPLSANYNPNVAGSARLGTGALPVGGQAFTQQGTLTQQAQNQITAVTKLGVAPLEVGSFLGRQKRSAFQ